MSVEIRSGFWRAVLPPAVGLLIAVFTAPQGLSQNAWYYFALFAGVVMALILEPIPAAAVGVVGVTLAAVLGLFFRPEQLADPNLRPATESIRWALAGFSNTTVWLIFGAFMFAMGYAKTGLGKRVALFLVKHLGGRTIGLGYAVTFADLILAPFTPSNTARSAGTIFPIIRNIPGLYDSTPGETSRKIGSYIMWTALSATCVTSSMFLTSMAPNLLAIDLVNQVSNLEISWTQWFTGFLPIGAPLILLLPLIVYKLHPPEIKRSTEVPSWAARELNEMGTITRNELVMAALVVLALGLWIFGGETIHATTVALVVISAMLVVGIATWDDILGNKQAWNVLVWFATLVTLADGLNKSGFVAWFARGTAASLTGMSPITIMVILLAVFFVIHYMFASTTAHATAVLPVMFAAGAAVPGMPVRAFALLLCFSLGIMGIITPYATGPSPVYYASGYVARKDFWVLGFVFGILFLTALLTIGVPYLTAVYPA